MAHLMVGDDLALARAENPALLLDADDDPFDRLGEVGKSRGIRTSPGRDHRRLIDEVGDVGAGKSRDQGCNRVDVEIGGGADLLEVNAKDIRPPLAIDRRPFICKCG